MFGWGNGWVGQLRLNDISINWKKQETKKNKEIEGIYSCINQSTCWWCHV
jgi:hypothetical protein